MSIWLLKKRAPLNKHSILSGRRALHKPTGMAGFTLIELMVVVGIIAILAAIAYPAYTSFIIKGRRAEGRGALVNLLQQEEAYITQKGTYQTFSAGDQTYFHAYSNDSSNTSSAAYKLGARLCTNSSSTGTTPNDCIQVFADPVRADPPVGELTIDSTGAKSCASGNMSLCWP